MVRAEAKELTLNYEYIKPQAVVEALKDLPDAFRTKELSEHPSMLRAHDGSDPEYHKSVGRYLSVNGSRHGVHQDRSRQPGKRGAAWTKSSAIVANRKPAPDRDEGQLPAAADIGPQYAGDAPFTARMRFHQSHYRATVLSVPPGTGPTASDARSYGNMLRRIDGATGMNFLTPEIFAVAQRRLGQSSDRVEPFRLLHNMLSSQPMCFNLFGPLVGDPDRARRMIGSLLPGKIARVLQVLIEYAPAPASDYLQDRTSFDALVEYEVQGGGRAILCVETKLTDSFSPKRYDRPEYRRWMSGPRNPWRDDAHEAVTTSRHNQIWRDHLLGVAMRDRLGSPFDACKTLIAFHPLDRDAASAVDSYRSLLRQGDDTLRGLHLGHIAERFESAVATEEEALWLKAFQRRYLDLGESDAAWALHQAP